jgi:23S rRNA pseudouridine1911/1915/1917 synthase
MSQPVPSTLIVAAEQKGVTLAAVVRTAQPGASWSRAKELVTRRFVRINGELCLDPARRLSPGEHVEVLARPDRPKPDRTAVALRHVDEHVVVVEKPSGISTVRHPAERDWSERRRALSPTLEDLVVRELAPPFAKKRRDRLPRLRVVHRIDKETSGLVVFARTVPSERGLGKQFHAHTVVRRYLAVVPGFVPPQVIQSFLVRDRGDGRRGSTAVPGLGKEAVTHVDVAERLPGYTVLACRLETGRTHQIRIHLAELGHPVCGDPVYHTRPNQPPLPDESGAPRLALHAAELGFQHPVTGERLHWSMPLASDLEAFLERLRGQAPQV